MHSRHRNGTQRYVTSRPNRGMGRGTPRAHVPSPHPPVCPLNRLAPDPTHPPAQSFRALDGADKRDTTQRVLRLQLRVRYTGRDVDAVVTHSGDGTWTTSAGPVTEDSVYGGEHYDARIAHSLSQRGWDRPGFGQKWPRATAVPGPSGVMVPWAAPPVAVSQVLWGVLCTGQRGCCPVPVPCPRFGVLEVGTEVPIALPANTCRIAPGPCGVMPSSAMFAQSMGFAVVFCPPAFSLVGLGLGMGHSYFWCSVLLVHCFSDVS